MRSKPHIVHVVGTMGMGGAQKQVLNLVTSPILSDYTHSIICAISCTGEFLQPALNAGISVYECPIRWPKSTPLPSYQLNKVLRERLQFTFPYRLAALLKSLQADIVHTQITTAMLWQAQAVLRMAKLPWIWTLRGLYKSRGEDTSQWVRTLEMIAINPDAMITGVSQAVVDEIIGFKIVPEAKLQVIHNGIDTPHLFKSSELRVIWRERYNIPPDALVFGSAGRLIPVKRYDLAVQAFVQLAHDNNNVHFALAGDGELMGEIKAQAQQFGIEEQFHLLGFQPDINAFLNVLDVFVLTSDSEGLPNVILEALSLDLPCVSTAVGGVPEVLDNVGVLVPPDSVEALTKAMQSMISPDKRVASIQGSRIILRQFDMATTAEKYKKLYEMQLKSSSHARIKSNNYADNKTSIM